MKVKLFISFPVSHLIENYSYLIICDYLEFNDCELVAIYHKEIGYGLIIIEVIYNYDLVIFKGN